MGNNDLLVVINHGLWTKRIDKSKGQFNFRSDIVAEAVKDYSLWLNGQPSSELDQDFDFSIKSVEIFEIQR